ncbi:leucine-rich repeat domain-containing protein [Streptosporangium roseum]|uniref:leucine-rich repeat domain-containing protein n=1 Tax=Streptosporangium roseum TaxID=2001 RepID=UPI0033172237
MVRATTDQAIDAVRAAGGGDLDLARRGLTTVQESIRRLSGVTDLDLSGNRLTSLPNWIGSLADLTRLDLSDNALSVLPDAIGDPTNLRELRLKNTRISALPASIGKLTRIATLDVDYNQLTKPLAPSATFGCPVCGRPTCDSWQIGMGVSQEGLAVTAC